MSRAPRVVIAGGGIAGLAAALALVDRGLRPTLIESRRKLGGRATSHTDPQSGESIDNCQHVTLGCCSAYMRFCRRLGVLSELEWTREQYWLEPGGRESILARGWLPAPLHFSWSFLNAAFLSAEDKIAIGDAMRRIWFARRQEHREQTFGSLLKQWEQTERAISRFWNPVIVSALNLMPDRASAAPAIQVFQTGFLATASGSDIGVSRIPLVRLYDAAESILRDAGGELRLGESVESVSAAQITADSGEFACDAAICAMPFERAVRALPPDDPRRNAMSRIDHSPILGVHMRFDRPVLHRPHAVLVEQGTHWLFRKNQSGDRLHAVISAADDWMGLTESQILRRVCADVQAALPAARGATLEWGRAIKEKRATFAATPAFETERVPSELPSGDGVVLAGDYTDTGWPATMESAARSGFAAAEAVCRRLIR